MKVFETNPNFRKIIIFFFLINFLLTFFLRTSLHATGIKILLGIELLKKNVEKNFFRNIIDAIIVRTRVNEILH